MRQTCFFPSGEGWSMSRSRHQRKAVRVLPVPVGARIRALSPRAITGHPMRWGAVGASNTALNHSAVTGWKQANASESETISGLGGEEAICDFEDSARGWRRGSETGNQKKIRTSASLNAAGVA